MPALAYHFGVRPWEVDDLTFGEVAVFLEALHDLTAEGGATRGRA